MSSIITVYGKHYCPYCKRAKAYLDEKNLSYDYIEVADNEENYQEMLNRIGEDSPRTVPRIFFGDTLIGGCDDLLALPESELNDLLTRG